MAVVIRMKRGGRTHEPYYRIVVADSRKRDQGPVVDQLGVYHPCARPKPVLEIDMKKALEWLYKGAQYSDTARDVLSRKGILKAFQDGVKPEDLAPPAPVAEPVVEVAAVAEVAAPVEEAAPVAEAPVEAAVEAPEAPAGPAAEAREE
ncbi:MAG: small subunit ribosomal protein [Candidatus Hydrogenedentes bacterium]|nr:small subunit ribosomal protein [Candidatus Hydrogenedentota bacterium]